MQDYDVQETQEIYKKINRYPNYEISNFGNIRNTKTKKVLKSIQQTAHGYLTVNLLNGKDRRTELIHRLVAETFIPNPMNLPEVNHKNLDKHDNRSDNLEFVTRQGNVNHYHGIEETIIEQRDMITDEVIDTFCCLNDILKKYPTFNKSNIDMNINGWIKSAYAYKWVRVKKSNDSEK